MEAKTQRVLAALNGDEADRVPFAAWMHLATQHLEPLETARLHEHFFSTYDLDIMKVMNDYPYPHPPDVEQVDSVDAMRRFEPLGSSHTAFDQQLEVIRELRRRLGPDLIILDTVFNPFGVAQVLLKQSLDETQVRQRMATGGRAAACGARFSRLINCGQARSHSYTRVVVIR